MRSLEDYEVDRRKVYAQQCVEPIRTNMIQLYEYVFISLDVNCKSILTSSRNIRTRNCLVIKGRHVTECVRKVKASNVLLLSRSCAFLYKVTQWNQFNILAPHSHAFWRDDVGSSMQRSRCLKREGNTCSHSEHRS